ncbi:hypothetical protein QBC39DRAFT_334231 [Podospora conica]|nr:hypothetical protein QBC39DRAFT_334231 [Schizothecium conicum]
MSPPGLGCGRHHSLLLHHRALSRHPSRAVVAAAVTPMGTCAGGVFHQPAALSRYAFLARCLDAAAILAGAVTPMVTCCLFLTGLVYIPPRPCPFFPPGGLEQACRQGVAKHPDRYHEGDGATSVLQRQPASSASAGITAEAQPDLRLPAGQAGREDKKQTIPRAGAHPSPSGIDSSSRQQANSALVPDDHGDCHALNVRVAEPPLGTGRVPGYHGDIGSGRGHCKRRAGQASGLSPRLANKGKRQEEVVIKAVSPRGTSRQGVGVVTTSRQERQRVRSRGRRAKKGKCQDRVVTKAVSLKGRAAGQEELGWSGVATKAPSPKRTSPLAKKDEPVRSWNPFTKVVSPKKGRAGQNELGRGLSPKPSRQKDERARGWNPFTKIVLSEKGRADQELEPLYQGRLAKRGKRQEELGPGLSSKPSCHKEQASQELEHQHQGCLAKKGKRQDGVVTKAVSPKETSRSGAGVVTMGRARQELEHQHQARLAKRDEPVRGWGCHQGTSWPGSATPTPRPSRQKGRDGQELGSMGTGCHQSPLAKKDECAR